MGSEVGDNQDKAKSFNILPRATPACISEFYLLIYTITVTLEADTSVIVLK